MHLALKSAMSRIPYTNKVGETLSSIANSAAAYSLRSLGGGDPMVARVRRSSDDAEKDFTASDMDSGSVADWVNEQLNLTSTLNPTVVGSNADWVYTAIDDSNYDIEAINNSATRFLRLKNTSYNGNTKYRFTFDYTVISGTSNLTFNRATPWNVTTISEGFNSIELDLTDDSIIQFRCATGATFKASIRNITVTAIESDGHVTTWYDQSGNDNHATQATAASQPKIVDGGTLVSNGIGFDGVDDFLDTSCSLSAPCQFFFTGLIDNTDKRQNFFDASIGSRALASWRPDTSPNSLRLQSVNTPTGQLNYSNDGTFTNDVPFVLNFLLNGLNSEISKNGTILASGDAGSASINSLRIAKDNQSIGEYCYSGTISEIIIYNSDQSANRAAIETNINNYYDIY